MLVTCGEMSEAERRFFAGGVSPEPYMDEAGKRCAAAILAFFPDPGRAELFCGKGNNAGDALVVGRWLRRRGWQVVAHFSHGPEGLSELARKKLAEFEAEAVPSPGKDALEPTPLVLIDGLVGIGARGELKGEILTLAERLNAVRLAENAICFSIDLPSGLDADTGRPGKGAVVADFTLSITAAKTGFAADSAIRHVGRLVEIPLDIPVESGDPSKRFLFPSNLRPRLPRRPFDLHKGLAGRVAIVAGSRGFSGAAVLSALGASRGGAGLVVVHVPESIYPIVAAQAPPEVMVRPFASAEDLAGSPADVLAIGPGLGAVPAPGLLEFLRDDPRPVVIDADALNALAREPEIFSELPPNRLLTPHPGELARLAGAGVSVGERGEVARRCAEAWGVSLLFKGARTVVASPGRPLEWNTTGHPGMASGGMGDVLTGLCAALAGQGLSLHDAACLGSWLLGRAAELAVVRGRLAPESVSAPDVADHLGGALRDLRIPGTP